MRPAPGGGGGPSREDRLQFILIFLIVYAALLFAIRPEPSRAQVVLRTLMILVGVVGLGVLRHRKRR